MLRMLQMVHSRKYELFNLTRAAKIFILLNPLDINMPNK